MRFMKAMVGDPKSRSASVIISLFEKDNRKIEKEAVEFSSFHNNNSIKLKIKNNNIFKTVTNDSKFYDLMIKINNIRIIDRGRCCLRGCDDYYWTAYRALGKLFKYCEKKGMRRDYFIEKAFRKFHAYMPIDAYIEMEFRLIELYYSGFVPTLDYNTNIYMVKIPVMYFHFIQYRDYSEAVACEESPKYLLDKLFSINSVNYYWTSLYYETKDRRDIKIVLLPIEEYLTIFKDILLDVLSKDLEEYDDDVVLHSFYLEVITNYKRCSYSFNINFEHEGKLRKMYKKLLEVDI